MIDTYAHAAVRFGLGPRAGETPAADPRGWLLGQLDGADSADFSGLPSTSDAIRELMRQRAAKRADPQDAMMIHPGQDMLRAEAAAQMGHAIGTDAPFRERLVWFWTNHFTVSLKRGEINALVGPYVREAIRPHVTGRFADMLLAVMRHPAMLIYLDNQDSAGPNSLAHAKRQAGLNENLGRESLELHTVTPAAGYTQADVTAYSRVLTGWSVDMKDDAPGFQFRPAMQDPGAKTVLGRSFPAGEAGGVAALTYLGTHPATYRALATALARHFIADMPPADAVERIAAVLGRSGGDLRLAAAAVVAEPGAWRPLAKLRAPQDYMVAVLRAAPAAVDPHDAVGMLAGLGQPLWTAPLPNGWGDRAADWCDPELLLRRADWAFQIAGKLGDADWERADPERVAADSLGRLLRPATLTAMQGAASRREALALLFTSPEFMRR